MIITTEVEITITPRNITHYRGFGYKVEFNDKIIVDVRHLNKWAKVKVLCKCEICGKEILLRYEKYRLNYERFNYYSCKGCSNKKRVLNAQQQWGVDNYSQTKECQEKVEKTNLEKYGVKCIFLDSKIKEKINNTNLEKYGTTEPLQNKEIRDKGKRTYLEKYGVDHYSKTEEFSKRMIDMWENKTDEEIGNIIKKTKKTCLERYGVDSFSKTDNFEKHLYFCSKEFKDKHDIFYKEKYFNLIKGYDIISIQNSTYEFVCNENHIFKIKQGMLSSRIKSNSIVCLECNPKSFSASEATIGIFVKNNIKEEVLLQYKKFLKERKELDIYIPSLNIAFEFNGIYWHSEKMAENDGLLSKTIECQEKGVKLIHIFEDEWTYKSDIVESLILNELDKNTFEIDSSKCKIKIVSNSQAEKFLEEAHINGYKTSDIKIGLYYDSVIVYIMTFNKLSDNSYEIIQFSSEISTKIINGKEKILKYFIKKYNPEHIESCLDRCWYNGTEFDNIGFNITEYIEPSYKYVKNDRRFNVDEVLIKEGLLNNENEHEIMKDRKYYRIYDAGSIKIVWNK